MNSVIYQLRICQELQSRNVGKDDTELVHILPLEMVMELLGEEPKTDISGGFAAVVDEGSDHFPAISAISTFFGEDGFKNSCDYIADCLCPTK